MQLWSYTSTKTSKKCDFGPFWPLFRHFFFSLVHKRRTYMMIMVYFTSFMYILNKNTLSLGYGTSLVTCKHKNFERMIFLLFLASFFIIFSFLYCIKDESIWILWFISLHLCIY